MSVLTKGMLTLLRGFQHQSRTQISLSNHIFALSRSKQYVNRSVAYSFPSWRPISTSTPKRVAPAVVGVRVGVYAIGRFIAWLRKYLPAPLQKFLSPFTIGALALCGTGFIVYESIEVNPITGRRQLCLISHETLLSMAEEAEHEYLVQFQPVLADPSQQEHRQAERILKRFAPMLYYVNANILNAFVLPNGAVFLFDGLAQLVHGDEDALACILGHEICHVVANHGAERLNHAFVAGWFEMIASAVAGLLGLPWWVLPGAIPAAEFVESAMLAPHSRENEAEADEWQLGMYMASEACYNPRAAPQALQVWRSFARLDKGEHTSYFDTHPSHASREEHLTAILDDVLLSSAPVHCGGKAWPSVGDLLAAVFAQGPRRH